MRIQTTGRTSIFRGKDKSKGFIGALLTAIGHVALGHARKDLARMVKRPVKGVSIADTLEWCIRGRPQLFRLWDGTFSVGTFSVEYRPPSLEPKP